MKISSLTPNAKNPRTITDEKLAQLKKAITKFGDLSGIVFNRKSKQIVCGHQRVKTVEDADIVFTKKYTKPTKTGTVREGYFLSNGERFSYREVWWDDTTEKAANIAANKGAGEWDLPQLGEWLKDLSSFDIDFDMDLTMFNAEEIQALGQNIIVSEHTRVGKTGVDEDEVPEKAPPRTQSGDIYVLGDHRLACGDATDLRDMERLVQGLTVDMVWVDPPYNIDYVGKTKDALKIQNDKMTDEKFRDFINRALGRASDACTPGGAVYIAHSDTESYNTIGAARDAGWLVKQCLIWKKSSLVMGRRDYQQIHEPILYGWKDGGTHSWYSDRKQTTVLEFAKPSRSELHPTMKPVELVEYCISNSSKLGATVLDSFGGSGTTMIACEKIKRRCFMMELDPRYCDVIVERWEKYTGEKAKLQPRVKTQLRKTAKQPSSSSHV